MADAPPDAPAPDSDALVAARVAAFAAAAALSTVQDVVRQTLPALGAGAVPEVVAEETLALVATLSARAAAAGLAARPDARAAAGPALAEVPFLYHDYLLGAQMVAAGAEGDVAADASVYDRLARKAAFYETHLPAGRTPGPRALADVLPLWMGRVSPPRLPTTPEGRLGSLGTADVLGVHVRLVIAFAQKAAG